MRRLNLCTLLLLLSLPSFAQEPRTEHTSYHDQLSLGRDQWLTVPDPFEDSVQCFAKVATSINDLVHIAIGSGLAKTIATQPSRTATFNFDSSVILRSSGLAEDRAIHIWSNVEDVPITLLLHPKHSDQITIIEVVWLTDTVITARPATQPRTPLNDRPSEFALVSNTDSTIVSITPAADIREEITPGNNCDSIAHTRGIMFSVRLDRGDAIEFKTVCTNDSSLGDLTGTALHASNKIGVMLERDSILQSLDVTKESTTETLACIVPNPSSGFVHVQGCGLFELYSSLGVRVFREDVQSDQALDISALPTGVYWYSLRTGGVTKRGQLVIQR